MVLPLASWLPALAYFREIRGGGVGEGQVMSRLDRCAGKNGEATPPCLNSQKIALDPRLPGKGTCHGPEVPRTSFSQSSGVFRDKALSILLGAD